MPCFPRGRPGCSACVVSGSGSLPVPAPLLPGSSGQVGKARTLLKAAQAGESPGLGNTTPGHPTGHLVPAPGAPAPRQGGEGGGSAPLPTGLARPGPLRSGRARGASPASAPPVAACDASGRSLPRPAHKRRARLCVPGRGAGQHVHALSALLCAKLKRVVLILVFVPIN